MADQNCTIDEYCLDPAVRARIIAERPPIQYPNGIVPLETLRNCGFTGVRFEDVMNTLNLAGSEAIK